MPKWSEKRATYKVGSVTTVLAIAGYVTVFGLPGWRRTMSKLCDDDDADDGLVLYSGLWQHSCNGFASCQTYPVFMDAPLFQTSRSLASISLVLMCVSVVFILVHNCTQYAKMIQNESILVSILPLFSGVVAASSNLIFSFRPDITSPTYRCNNLHSEVTWGFYAANVNTLFVFIGGILMVWGSLRNTRSSGFEGNQGMVDIPAQLPGDHTIRPGIIPVTSPAPSESESSFPSQQPISNLSTSSAQPPTVTSSTSVPNMSTPVIRETPRANPSAPPPEFSDLYYYNY